MRAQTLSLLMLLITSISFGQVTVSGSITDSTGKPLGYATVKLLRIKPVSVLNTSLTDADGTYSMKGVKQGDYLLKVSMIGYLPDSTSVHITADQLVVNPFNFSLKRGVSTLAAVNVVSKKPLIEKRPDRLVVNIENSVIAGGSVWDAMDKLPAVEVVGDDITVLGRPGTVIYVDDKPTYLSGSQLSSFLRSMPGMQISRIEIITNPSAKYDAAGGSVINIVTKRERAGGWTADLTLSQAQGSYPKSEPSLSAAYNSKKLSLNGLFSYQHFYNYLERPAYVRYQGQPITFFDQQQFTKMQTKSPFFMAGMDYFFNTRSSAGFTVRILDTDRKDKYSGETLIYSPNLDSMIHTTSNRTLSNNLYLYTFNYKSKLDSTASLNIDVNYGRYKTVNEQNFDFTFLNPDNSMIRPGESYFNEVPSDVTLKAANIDYTKKFRNGVTMDAGVKSIITSSSSSLFYSQFKNGSWVSDGSRNNSFSYKEYINAAYVNVNKNYKHSFVQLGLRTEVMNADGETGNKLGVNRNYTQFFPSFTFHYAKNPKRQWDLSYSTRVFRPNFNYLNPFAIQFDPYTSSVGNAFLVPTYTNTLELAHTINKKYIIALSYENIKDRIETSVQQNNTTKQLENVIVNIDHCYYYRLYFILPFNITKWWVSNNTFNSYIIEYKTNIVGGEYHKSKPVFYINSQNSFTISRKVSAELTVYYRTPSLNGLFEVGERFFTDAGVRAILKPGKSSLRLSINDIFFTNRWEWAIDFRDQFSGFKTITDTRLVRLTYNHKFGKSKITRAARRKTGVEEEQGRLN